MQNGLCPVCRQEETQFSIPGFDIAYSYGSYEGVLRRLIQLYKYEHIPTLAAPLGRLLINGFPRHEQVDCLVPVPLHWLRRWRRGFNQSALLAGVLAKATGLPVASALERRASTKAQAGLSYSQRQQNVASAFRIAPAATADIAGKHAMLIDDVLTTGATVASAARVLRRAGARRVTVMTVARAGQRSNWELLQQSEFAPSRASFFDDEQEQGLS